jgi:hypothetical protein
MPNSSTPLQVMAESAAADYISSVLFVDDVITYDDSTDRSALPAQKMTDILSQDNISSCFYRCKKEALEEDQYEAQKDAIIRLLRINDICVLDWSMGGKKNITADNLDKDVSDNVGRGHFAQSIIDAVLHDESLCPRLLFIYTTEHGEVPGYLKELPSKFGGSQCDPSCYFWTSKNNQVRICVYFKDGVAGGHGIDPSRVIAFDELAPCIKKEFASLHEGILPIAMLRALSAIRCNTNQLLGQYYKELDPAFVIHRALIPSPTSADDFLTTMIADSIHALMAYSGTQTTDGDLVDAWLESTKFDSAPITIENVSIDNAKRHEWHKNGFGALCPKGTDVEKVTRGEAHLSQTTKVFTPDGTDDIDTINAKFAILTHHKSLFIPSETRPILTQGTVVQDVASGSYYLCIQQRCDSLRITKIRNFLFLPMKPVKGAKKEFDILFFADPQIIRLKISARSYDLKIYSFPKSTVPGGAITADKEQIFTSAKTPSMPSQKFRWVLDLKDSFAMRAANAYATQLTRVAIDQSEWLRRSTGK